jgi:hypothetical protein
MSDSVENAIGIGQVPRGLDGLKSTAALECDALVAQRMAEYQRAISARNGGVMPVPDGAAMAPEPEPTGTPAERLAAAKEAHAAAKARHVKIKDAYSRATDRVDADARDLARFNGVDDRLTRWAVAQAYDGASDDLPLSEQITLAERARSIERHELSSRALRHVAGELHAAEQAETETDRRLRAAASAVLMEQAAFLARELAGVQAHELELRQRIRSYGDVNLPGLVGATPLPFACIEALNSPRAETVRDLNSEAALREQHARLMADTDE